MGEVRSRAGAIRMVFQVLVLGLVAGRSVADAQSWRRGPTPGAPVPIPLSLEARLGRHFGLDAWSLGAGGLIPVESTLMLAPSADYYFDDTRSWQVNLDAMARSRGATQLSAGVGAAAAHRPFQHGDEMVEETRIGFNVVLSLSSRRGRAGAWPFLDARWTRVQGRASFLLVTGMAFSLRNPNARR